ncbi:MAG: DUF177 domain-containing protein [Proteobacteria bacterium]|nr:DUF177 domain-containing protein [Pseudomonadota bacterium]
MASSSEPQAEFSRLVPVDRLGEVEITEEISAEPGERAALARRFGLLSLDRLSATLRLERAGARNLVRVDGRLAAEVTQACVVTLEPVGAHLEKGFILLYDLDAAAAQDEVVVEPEAEEPPEPVGPHGIDLGEAVAQQLAIALDPYPRAPGAALPEEPRAADGPFAVLESLKRGR